MATQDSKNFIGIETGNGIAPPKGPRIMVAPCDFSIQASYTINLEHAKSEDKLEFCQGIFVDNTQNSFPFTATCHVTQQKLTWPAYSFGYLSFFDHKPAHIIFATSNGAIIINPIMTSFPVANMLQVVGATGNGNSNPVTVTTGQGRIAVTGTAAQLSAGAAGLANGITLKADKNNAAALFAGPSTVNNNAVGTGNGFTLYPGDSVNIPISLLSNLYVNGTAGDNWSWLAN